MNLELHALHSSFTSEVSEPWVKARLSDITNAQFTGEKKHYQSLVWKIKPSDPSRYPKLGSLAALGNIDSSSIIAQGNHATKTFSRTLGNRAVSVLPHVGDMANGLGVVLVRGKYDTRFVTTPELNAVFAQERIRLFGNLKKPTRA